MATKPLTIESVVNALLTLKRALPVAPFKAPKKDAVAADRYYQVVQARLLADKVSEALKAEEAFLKDHLIETIPRSSATGVAGQLARVTIVPKVRPNVTDWDALYAYIIKNAKHGAFALLQRRVSDTAVKEIWDSKKALPGVEPFDYKSLSVNKL